MKIEDIYHKIGQSIVDSLDEEWINAKLEIKHTEGSTKFYLNYFSSSNIPKNSAYPALDYSIVKAVKELHKITTEGDNNKWNRLEYKLTSEGEMDLEFIWDQQLFDELENL